MIRTDFDILHGVTPGKHFYQFYKTQEEMLRVLFPFFKAGLEKGEACLWLTPEENGTLSFIYSHLDDWLPHSLFYLSNGQLKIMSAEKWYIKEGRFSPEQAMDNAAKYFEEIQKAGFHKLRGAGDAAVIPHQDWYLLEEYEEKIGKVIKDENMIALCAYPILDCTLRETKMVLDVHDHALVAHL